MVVDTRRLNDLFRQRRLPAALDIARLPHRSPAIPVYDGSAALPAVAVVATPVRLPFPFFGVSTYN